MGKQALYLHGLLMSKGHMPYHLCDSRSAHGKDAGVGVELEVGNGAQQWCCQQTVSSHAVLLGILVSY